MRRRVIELSDYFGKVSHIAEPSEEVRANAVELLDRVNALLLDCVGIEAAENPSVNSGWRPASYNATIANAAPKSRHITGEAVDLSDPDGELDQFLFDNPQFLARHSLWMEHPLATKNWSHLQSVAPRSGNRIFIP
jgi:hypothetical protein